MIEAVLSFLGGTAFRMIWGEVSSFLTRRQEHKLEIERLKLQAEHDAAQHARNLEAIRIQHDLQVQVVRVNAEADIQRLEGDAFLAGVKATVAATGVRWVDAWNAMIRPGVASWAVGMLTAAELGAFQMSPGTEAVAFAALGLYLADRTLGKRGK